MSTEYVVVVEKSETGLGPMCRIFQGVSHVGETREETLQLVHEAIELHVARLRDAGEPIPPAVTTAERVSVHVAA
jgi:predicted RNase H-like HicB family nuclease